MSTRIVPPQPSRRVEPPSWETERPYLTGSALHNWAATCLTSEEIQNGPFLSQFPASTQQRLATEDSLFALLGVRTTFVGASIEEGGSVQYIADNPRTANSEAEIAPLLKRILTLANHHAVVRDYVEKTRIARSADGFVRQALGVALAELLGEYRQFVLRLEDELRAGRLSLQRLVYHVQPSLRSMALLRSIVEHARDVRGGAALDAVFKLTSSFVGSDELRDVLAFLVGRVAAPVLGMVDTWVGRGQIDDPFNEFFIQEDPQYAKGPGLRDPSSVSFWEHRYSVNADNLPDFLAPFVENILRAGKYLNVLRECGEDTALAIAEVEQEMKLGNESGAAKAIPGGIGSGNTSVLRLPGTVLLGPDAARRIGSMINRYYAASSKALMKYMRKEVDLVGRLRSLRRYFLLEQGDFVVHFFDAAHAELSKPRNIVSKTRLESLLELSVRTSVSAGDPYHDDLKCRLHTHDVASQMLLITGGRPESGTGAGAGSSSGSINTGSKTTVLSGYDAFSFDYRLEWPMNLIVSDIEILKYQLISRYLFHCKYVERELEGCWRNHAQVKGERRGLRWRFAHSFALRNRMLQFVRNMLYYTLADILEPNWSRLGTCIGKAETLDEIIEHHSKFLDSSLRECLVSNDKHLKVFYSITQVCILFAGYTERFSRNLLTPNVSLEEIEANLQRHNYMGTVAKFATRFDAGLRTLLDGVSAMSKKSASAHLANLCECLDIGGYYERSATIANAAYGLYSHDSVR